MGGSRIEAADLASEREGEQRQERTGDEESSPRAERRNEQRCEQSAGGHAEHEDRLKKAERVGQQISSRGSLKQRDRCNVNQRHTDADDPEQRERHHIRRYERKQKQRQTPEE